MTFLDNPIIAKFKISDGSHEWSYGIGGQNEGQFNAISGPEDDRYVAAVGYGTIWSTDANS